MNISRRQFIQTCGLASAATLWNNTSIPCLGADSLAPPVAVFSKVYQELKLTLEESAELTAEAGLDGIDCGVRPGGEILPEKAADEMPRYAELLSKHHVKMLLLTTGITGISTPHAETILRAGKKLGIRYYRIGYWRHKPAIAPAQLLANVKAELKDLAALNRELDVCAVFQNHSSDKNGSTYAGGNLTEMYDIMKDLDPAHMGVAFDLGHAIIMHGDEWSVHFEKLKSHIKVAYIKDIKRAVGFVPFGQGEFGQTDYFKRLKQMNYSAPLSMHIEFDWVAKGAPKTRAALAKVLKDSRQTLQQWLKNT